MNKTIKVTGLVEEPRQGNSARVRVLCYKKGPDYIKNNVQIIDEFQPHGFVFVRNVLDRYSVGSLIEIPVSFKERHPTNDNYVGDGHTPTGCHATGYRFFRVSSDVFLNPFSISLKRLKNEIPFEKNLKNFYVVCDDLVYGPFHYDGENVDTTVDVGQGEFDSALSVSSAGYCYFLKKPVALRKIDAMTTAQLAIWFKQKIKVLISPTIEDADEFLKESDFSGPDKGRLKRCIASLDNLGLGREELLHLSVGNTELALRYQNAIEKAWNEFTGPAQEEAYQLNLSIEEQNKIYTQLAKEYEINKIMREELRSDILHLESDRERLIRDIRMNILVAHPLKTPIDNFEIIDFTCASDLYLDYASFLQQFCQTLNLAQAEHTHSAFLAVGQLKTFKAILAPQIELILQLAQATRNATIILQNAEPNWLRFDHFYEAGLKQAFEYAWDNPSRLIFFTLQNFNISAIECYAAPLLDLLNGVRRKLPGFGQALPKNLWLFFIPMEQDPEIPFGLPLMRNTYRNWGAFPLIEGVQVPSTSSGQMLTLEQMLSHSMPNTPDFKAFFL